MPAHLPNARIRRCGEHVQVNRGLSSGSSSKGWLSEVILRCVAAGRRSALDVSSTLSVRREDLRRFTISVRRRDHSHSSASRDPHRTLTTTWRRRASVSSSNRHGRAGSDGAVNGPAVWTALRASRGTKIVPARPLSRGHCRNFFRHLAMAESRPCACTFHGWRRHRTTVPIAWVPAHTSSQRTDPNAVRIA